MKDKTLHAIFLIAAMAVMGALFVFGAFAPKDSKETTGHRALFALCYGVPLTYIGYKVITTLNEEE